MQKKLILLLVLMVLVAVFALQNSMEVEIKLWFWSVRTSMVLILILTFAAGAIAGILFSLPGRKKDPGKVQAEPKVQAVQQEPAKDEILGKEDEFEDVNR
jgi:type VI protein secretion system component VasK